MSRWSVAHRIAHIAAQGARGDAGWASDQRADVVGLIESNGVQVFGQHGLLFGAYLPAEPGRAPGVWLNAGLDVTAQRHTAAHEWGHHSLGHGARCDLDIEGVAPPRHGASRSLEETSAEAFAAWLLMPRAALASTLAALGCPRGTVPTALHCYETSLVLGTSYRGTARQLGTSRLVSPEVSKALMRVAPGKIKRMLDEPTVPPTARADIWCLAHFAGFDDLTIPAGDRLIVDHQDAEHGTVDALLHAGLAELVTETARGIVLTVLPASDRMTSPPVNICLRNRPTRIHFDQRVVGLADANTVPDLTDLTPGELARLLADMYGPAHD
ncbi:ImmA/IrrE family metallo-endopeptidase [Saccharothrix obliqua]|uniref:ImmA/IrrE family metallo-endopeptidase n=1 Tax=Saccharothrix obliqua TaxID=2861747 RepID=UPI001C5DD0BE|nr:ImmA/IrrE family metallo-endopeptidase [Saccharothrix obliqua]MBW4719796.1 ImmA/IrrE family metallo-endopeptidase [Saccharothrix obliqua]